VKRALLVAALALSACAAPASYDGLAGGSAEATEAKEDAAVVAPRQVSPLSVTLISSSRPRLRWDLGTTNGGNLTGAVVEMSRTRDFTGDVKRFHATGMELVVPEDLEAGIWFWRLKGRSAGLVGTATSAVWEMLVRGPAAHGSSDTPTRSMVDMNGDGEPDLLIGGIAAEATESAEGPEPVLGASATAGQNAKSNRFSVLMAYGGDRVRGFAGGMTDGYAADNLSGKYTGPMSIGGGTDFTGDGLTDVIAAGLYGDSHENELYFDVNVLFAAAGDTARFESSLPERVYQASGMPALPNVREGGDIDGDGYGDSVIGLVDTGMIFLGTRLNGAPAAISVNPGLEAGSTGKLSSRLAFGGFDANGDGLADVAFSMADSYQPTARAAVSVGSREVRLGEQTIIDAADARFATAFTAGDFNGDGVDDLAITTAVDPSTRVCIWFGDRAKVLRRGPCVTAAAGDVDFGASLTAADIEGDGVDELLATTKSDGTDGVRVLRVAPDGATATSTPIGLPGLGVRLTTIWPGRPGKARWAAVAADGSRIGVFEGADLRTTLTPPPGVVAGFGRGLR
jgi:hypothetical protein